MKIWPELTGQKSSWSNVEAIEERQTEEAMDIYLTGGGKKAGEFTEICLF